MSVSYNKLWKLLIDRGMKRTQLKSLCGISSNVLARLGKNENVSVDSLEKICKTLGCTVDDILDFTGGETDEI